jgi:hypothetical protein
MSEIATQFLFEVTIDVASPLMVGETPSGDRRIVQITGGHFAGPRLSGTVLPGGSDWILGRPDGVLALDVRATLRTADGALINMTYRGLRHGPVAVIDRLNRGEPVDASEYYFRTAPFFETSAPAYAWLNKIVAIATGRRLPTGPVYKVYEVL